LQGFPSPALDGQWPASSARRTDRHLVIRSPLRDAGSADRNRPTGFVSSSIASQTVDHCALPTDGQRRNPHSA